jgi:hypothetical protein
MKKMLGLGGLILITIGGCELHRPYTGHCLLAREEMGYRPKTVVTMRAETLPEAAQSAEGTSKIQLVSASTNVGTSTGGAATSTGSMATVTVMIPAMKIILPVNTAALNKAPAPVKAAAAVTQLPPISGPTVTPNSTAPSPVQSASSSSDMGIQNAIPTQGKEELTSHIDSAVPHLEPVPELKSAANSESPKKKVVDTLRPSKLSLLPPPDPPDVPGRASTGTTSDPAMEVPPPPLIAGKSSQGLSLPAVDPERK